MSEAVHAVAARCAECGEPLSQSGGCLACLLRAGLDDDDAALGSARGDTTFGDFEIERREDGSLCELGRGAVGITYRAIDKVLHRAVALKVIEPVAASDVSAMRERFLREARAAAGLRHPNIATVFQFGSVGDGERCYCAMELVEGETLEAHVRRNGPITPDVAFDIGMQVAAALIAAAERGLVHRDLKPGNIMLTRGENGALHVKVIDFGLAKAISTAEQMELTHGSFVGTPAFASPEQFAGEAVDARSDIYALGVTLWFALTGRLPSAGTSVEEIRQRQARRQLPVEQLQARGVPQPVVELLRSCLAIDPADRPASARELLRAFEACRMHIARRRRRRISIAFAVSAVALLGAVIAAGALRLIQLPATASAGQNERAIEKGVAVLPFENLTADKADAFLSDGIQDDLRTTLAKIKDLKVIARASVEEYRGADRISNVREIGRALGVSHVVDGSVRRAGDRVVLNVALIDTQQEREVWAERYERPLTDALSLQRQLSVEIARALEATLRPADSTMLASAPPTANPDAYLLYLRGREAEFDAQSKPKEAVEFYEQAIQLDPAFALARARLGIVAGELAHIERDNPAWAEKARTQTAEALRLQPELGEAHLALTTYHLMVERDYDRALAQLTRTAEFLPNSAEVSLTAAFIYKLKFRYRDRIAALRRAEALDPRNTRVLLTLARTFRWVRDWPEAIRALDRAAVPKRNVPVAARVQWTRANDEFRLTGDLNVLKSAIAQEAAATPPLDRECIARSQFEIAMFERNFDAAERWLADIPAELGPGTEHPNISPHTAAFHRALLLVARGGGEMETRQTLEHSARELEMLIAQPVADFIRPASLHCDLGIIQAFLGRKEEAIASAQRGAELELSAAPSIEKNNRAAALALIHARTGEPEKALDLIEHLLTVPCEVQMGEIYNMTLADLKWRWIWDPLRDHPRFQKLLAGPEPKTVF